MSTSGSKIIIFAAMGANLLIAVIKFVASMITGSSAMFSEGIHSLVDTGNQILLLYGMKRAAKSPTDAHPFGYGKEIYFWSFVVAVLIFAIGGGISLYEGIHKISHPEPIKNYILNYIILGISIALEGVAWSMALKEFNKERNGLGIFQAVHQGKDPSLFVVLFEDTAAILGLIVALVFLGLSQFTGNPVFDGVASLIIGIILSATAIWLAVESKGLLVGESAHSYVVNGIREIVNKQDDGILKELLTMHMGPKYILVNMSMDFKDSLSSAEVEAAIEDITRRIKSEYHEVRKVFIESESLIKK